MKRTTIAMLALAAALPAVARAQDTTRTRDTTQVRDTAQVRDTTQARDTTQQTQQAPRTPADTNKAMQAQTQGATGTVRPSARAGTTQGRRSSRSMKLTRDQVMQLQSALSGVGCDAGTADGVMGPRTRRAITCARQKNNVSSNEELYRSLNLDFSTPSGGGASSSAADSTLPSSNTQGVSADNPAANATRGDSSQVGGANRGRIYPPADSVRRSPGANTSGTRDSVMPNKAPGRDTTSRP